MKKWLRLLCAGCLLLLTGGCWDRVELNDLGIVTAAGIDKKDDDQIELSIQVFIPKVLSSGGGQGGGAAGGGDITLVRFQQGENIADALSKLQSKLPRKIFWGQCKVFIVGEELAKEGIQEQVDFLLRHPQPRERAYMYVSKGTARKILHLIPPLERHSAEVIRELSDLQIGMQVTMQDLDEMLTDDVQAAMLPFIKKLPPQEGKKEEETIPYIVGTAVFKKDQMVGKITERETRGILWLRNEMQAYTVTVEPEGAKGSISLNPVSARVKMVPHIQGEQWKMLVKVDTEGAVVQNGTNLNLASPAMIKKVEKAYEKAIKERIELTLKRVQHEMKADVAGFGEAFHRKYPKEWKKVKKNWGEVFPTIEVTIDVEAHIRRQGYISTPGGLPEDEVKEK